MPKHRKRKTAFALQVKPLAVILMATFAVAPPVYGLVIEEDFTGAGKGPYPGGLKNQWLMPDAGGGVSSDSNRPATNQACLTSTNAGRQTATATRPGVPGKCSNRTDAIGLGALRLTPDERFKVGGIVSSFTFPTNEGVDISFISYTWNPKNWGDADGMTFFLADGSRPASLGASGGSLGYSCSNANPMFEGVDGGYLGVGIDEWGNFANGSRNGTITGDNTHTGMDPREYLRSDTANSVGGKLTPGTIAVRGKNNIAFSYMGEQWLRDVYAARGWAWGADAENKLRAFKRDFWGNGSIAKRAEHIRYACRTGRQEILSQYLPNGQRTLQFAMNIDHVRKDANGKELAGELFNGKFLGYSRLPRHMNITAKVDSRQKATPISYRIKITKDGMGSVWYAYNGGDYIPIILNKDFAKINGSLPKSFRFGFAGSTGGSVNNHDVTCFKATSADESQGNLSVNLPTSEIIQEGEIYHSMFNNYYWTGQVLANTMVVSNDKGLVIQEPARWDAACLLDGGSIKNDAYGVSSFTAGQCASTGKTVPANPDYKMRNTWTWNGNSGVSMDWSNLSAVQRASLQQTGEDETMAKARLEFLKGDRSNEKTDVGVGLFRARRSILGDIIDSSPVWVGYPDHIDYSRAKFTGGETSYADFKKNNMTRTSVVYAGSNDGFMHAFRAGTHDANANTIVTPIGDGKELLAYMPSSVLQRITRSDTLNNSIANGYDYSHENYAHNYYNNATPGIGDVFYGGKWHTLLMSGLGEGGNTIYALDVTNPENFSKTNAGSHVIGEWSYDARDNIWKNLGNTYGTPVFGRFQDGNWGAVFGNGWCSTTDAENGNCTANAGPAGIYVMTLDKTTGQPSFRFISTGESGTTAEPNGIAHVTPFDVDGDYTYDYAYAGDIKGNVWRFDLTANSASTWAATAPTKMFTTRTGQPISTKVLVTKNDTIADGDVVLNFGTGIKKNGYLGGKTTYATGTQSIYGLRDRFARTKKATTFIDHSKLLRQTINTTTGSLSTEEIKWNTNSGWYMDLGHQTNSDGKVAYEQVIYDMYMNSNKFLVVNSFIEAKTASLTCDEVPQTGYTYPLMAESGGGIKGFFDENSGTAIRYQFDATGKAQILTTKKGDTFLLSKNVLGQLSTKQVFLPKTGKASIRRLSWHEIF